jgi:hypothetical protein
VKLWCSTPGPREIVELSPRIGLIDAFFIEYVHPGDNPEVMFCRQAKAGTR